ncbi:alpha/beta hydrolase [Nocardiopsis rhodophaea]|uniref:alpha/beta hydrolase n=1 Tax=Nocardiopsis rhodophaea TaxID=280238 RepID=UPI0031DA0070
MELTSPVLLWTVSACTIAAFVAVIVFWRHAARAGLRGLVARVVMIGVVQLCALSTLALVANLHFSFYGTWDDLLGHDGPADAAPTDSQKDGGESVAEPLPDDDVTSQVPERMGKLEKVQFKGARSGLSDMGYVLLPPEYFSKAHAEDRFPVGILLTGFPGEARNLVERMKLPKVVSDLRKQGRVQPMIWVMARPSPEPPRDTECVDVPGGPQAGTYYAEDLPEALSNRYRTAPTAKGWAIMGNSSGGSCAMRTAMMNPNSYTASVSLAGDFRAIKDKQTGDLYGGSQQFRNENDLFWRLKNRPMPPIDMLVTRILDGGDGNPSEPKEFADLAKPPMRIDLLERKSGGHNFVTWNAELYQAVPWVSERMKVEDPGASSSSTKQQR